jgi:hypothetical protein
MVSGNQIVGRQPSSAKSSKHKPFLSPNKISGPQNLISNSNASQEGTTIDDPFFQQRFKTNSNVKKRELGIK